MDILWIGPEDHGPEDQGITLTNGELWYGCQKLGSVPWHEWEPWKLVWGQVRPGPLQGEGGAVISGRERPCPSRSDWTICVEG